MNERSSADSEAGEPLPERDLRDRPYDTPEADALEQRQTVDDAVDDDRTELGAVDAAEADVVEQRTPVEDDDERRDG